MAAAPGARAVSAQTLYGSVVGTIKDTSDATLPGVNVTLQNRETNLVLTATTNESGTYTFTNVLPGSYDVRASLAGFKELTKTSVPITAGAVSRIDLALPVGDLTENVTVASEPALLQTDKADTHTEFKSKQIEDLPLSDFRNYQSLLDLVPGATPADFQNNEIDTPGRSLQTTVNGTNPNNNSTRVDGATNQNTWLPHHTLYVAPAETIDTVNVSTSSFEADQGMAGGSAITVITKSGTNQLRGSGFAFYSDEHLRARNYLVRQEGREKLPSSHHIDGGTLGGPIVRNKVFFFAAFEGQYRRTPQEVLEDVPTAAIRAGDFSDARNANGSLQAIYDPRTGDVDGRGRQPFAGNVIPDDRINPIARRIIDYYPLPNRPGNTDNYLREYTSAFDRNQYDLKINWNRSPSHQVWGKLGVMDAEVSNLFKLGFEDQGGGLGKTKTWVGTIGHTWTASPSLVIDGTIGYSLLDQFGYGPDYGTNYGTDVLGIPGTNGPDIRQSGFPEFATGYTTLGPTESFYPYTRYDPSWTFATNVTKLAGAHQLRLGGTVDRLQLNHWQPEVQEGPRGRFDFSGNITGLRGGPQGPNTFNTFATFLLGLQTQARKTLQWEDMTAREWRFGLYASDRWQLSERLTLNLGLRWEYYPLVRRATRGIERLDYDTMEVLLGGVGSTPMNVGLDTRKTDFAPRVGLAWRLNDKTVARTGYGLTYNPLPFSRPLRGFYPLTVANNYVTTNSWQPRGTLEDGIPLFTGPSSEEDRVPLPAETAMRSPDPDNVYRGHIQSWNVAIERRLPLDLSVTTAYVGTKTTRGYANRELNVSPPGGGEGGRRFFEEFGRTAATAEWGGITRSNYHALQIALDRPFKGGLFLKGQYTYSKALNMADEDGWVDLIYNSDEQFDRNYARAGFDRPHNFSIGYVYALPFAQESRGSLLGAMIKDWQVNGTFQAYSGTPFTVNASNSALDQRGDAQTADQIGDLVWLGPSLDHPLYEIGAFQNLTAQARYGNMGRNALRGPGYWNYNMSLFRSFPLGGRTRLQFRVEGFALGNNPRWRNPATDQRNVGNANFLKLTEVNDSGTRNVRLGVRLSF